MQLVTHFQPRDFNVVSAMKPVNREKNRSTDHLPMENGRVHLTPKPGVDGSDYINGTWLMGHQRLREFIITQHPLPNTTLDFWQMVWDHNAQTIVVLTSVEEDQGYPQFWPAQHDDFDSEHWKVYNKCFIAWMHHLTLFSLMTTTTNHAWYFSFYHRQKMEP